MSPKMMLCIGGYCSGSRIKIGDWKPGDHVNVMESAPIETRIGTLPCSRRSWMYVVDEIYVRDGSLAPVRFLFLKRPGATTAEALEQLFENFSNTMSGERQE